MSENKVNYRQEVSNMGKKEFTLIKMQEYGFWPKNLPTPYEKQANETPEQYQEREKLQQQYQQIAEDISKLYTEKDAIDEKLRDLQKQFNETWDYEKIKADVAQEIMRESIARRKAKKEERELAKQQRSKAWLVKKADNIVFIGKGYSGALHDKETNAEKLNQLQMPVITTDKELAQFLAIEYKQLRYLTYHRDVVTFDNYHRHTIAKKKGGLRNLAAPKPILKTVQRKILDDILCKKTPSQCSHGFLAGKSVVSNAKAHKVQPELLLTMDIEDFFPTITFERVRGMFKGFGYSGYIASLLAMICTYCERMPIEVRGIIKQVKTSNRILPQGAPTSPMISNILCWILDERLSCLADTYNATYTRYADDMAFSFPTSPTKEDMGKIAGMVCGITRTAGFYINRDKTKYLRKHNCQRITNIVINNEQIGITKRWLKTFRAAVYNANKVISAGNKLETKKVSEICGMASWLQSVNPTRYEKIVREALQIVKK